ncbi:MAG: glycosyltransferase [Flaviramulus sp.]|nr:glycosyltransferase [Flaviramulus sp.]NNC50935.1 glycosyltransferase [Flaviramulus sp.]
MKILMVSMNSIHFERWTEQLKDTGHEIYWFNVRDGGYSHKLSWVKQIVGWKHKYPNFKGRTFIKKSIPWLYEKLGFIFTNNTEKAFEKSILEIKPDVVHSFVLYISCVPILTVMQKHSDIKWIYSSWGSDLFYFQHHTDYLKNIKSVLPRVNFLFTDCKRDVALAKKYGFNGELLGVYPGGGGYPIEDFKQYLFPLKQRNTILVKGYQGRSGRAINVLKAIIELSDRLKKFPIVVFGADKEVEDFIKNSHLNSNLDFTIYSTSKFLSQLEIIKLMGEALIYIGNSNSDGMPNTLLEAIIMGAFPIQSNPGGATSEIIEHNKNGLLINDCDDVKSIAGLINTAINDETLRLSAFRINQNEVKPNLNREEITNRVILNYNSIIN